MGSRILGQVPLVTMLDPTFMISLLGPSVFSPV